MVYRRFFILFLLMPLAAHSKTVETPLWAKVATIGGCLCGAGLIAYKYIQARAANNQISEPSDQKLDQELKEELDKKFGPNVRAKIAKIALKEFELLAYEDRQKLLPAVIFVKQNNLRTIGLVTRATGLCAVSFGSYHSQDIHNKIYSDRPIALNACFLSPHYVNEFREVNCLERQKNGTLFIKNETHPRITVGRSLQPGECFIIGYSDGDVQIHLHDSDRRLLNELSFEQREFIKWLYQAQDRLILLNDKQHAVFKSLPLEMRACLKKNYKITAHAHRSREQLDTLMSLAGQSIAMTRAVQTWEKSGSMAASICQLVSYYSFYYLFKKAKISYGYSAWLAMVPNEAGNLARFLFSSSESSVSKKMD